MIALIVAKANNNVIGMKNDLPWRLGSDLKHFKELTTGHTVVMGLNTYNSIYSRLGHALPDRRNVVLTRETEPLDGAETIRRVDDIAALGDVYIIGGAMLYAATMGLADRLYVTEVKADLPGDVYFPAIDLGMWREISREPHEKDEKNDYDYDFVVYDRSL